MSQSDEDYSWLIWGVIVVGGVYYAYNHLTEDSPSEPLEVQAPLVERIIRPTGKLPVTRLDNGTVWSIEADDVRGPREMRMVWLVQDHTENTDTKWRSTHTLYQIDCATTAYKILSVLSFDPEGNPSEKFDFDPEKVTAQFAVPESNAGAVIRVGCMPEFELPAK